MCDYPQETILNFYKGKDEKIRRFGGVNKHLFRKIDLITKARSLLYIWHNSDSLKLYESVRRLTLLYYLFFLNANYPTLAKFGLPRISKLVFFRRISFVKGVPYGFCSKIMSKDYHNMIPTRCQNHVKINANVVPELFQKGRK